VISEGQREERCLAADHAVQVFAAEHFNEVVQRWTCSAAPVHDPDSGELLGVIDITGLMRTQHAHSLAIALTTAHAVESDLRIAMHERDARLRAHYRDRVEASCCSPPARGPSPSRSATRTRS
jgi:transcriptional regulator of acetoin/glycerol metabolism